MPVNKTTFRKRQREQSVVEITFSGFSEKKLVDYR